MTGYDALDGYPRDPRSVVTMGTFDGVHRGHAALVGEVVRRARITGGPSVAVTFEPHPREVVRGAPIPLLTPPAERARLLAALGLDRLVVLPFTRATMDLDAAAFVRDVLVGAVGAAEVVVGHDHHFGKGRGGTPEALRALGEAMGFRVDTVPAVVVDGAPVSSSRVRAALGGGAVGAAERLLGRRYAVAGTVVAGDRRGRTLGFPTINVAPDDARTLLPAHGVYAVRVETPGGERGGVASLGVRPTFDGADVRLEAYLFDFDGDLYGAAVRVEFVERLREERRYPDAEALVAQMREDAAVGRAILASVP